MPPLCLSLLSLFNREVAGRYLRCRDETVLIVNATDKRGISRIEASILSDK